MNNDNNLKEKTSDLYESQKGNIQNAKEQVMSGGGNKSGGGSGGNNKAGGLDTEEMKEKAMDAMNKMKGSDKMKDSFGTKD
ncbi:unnamed protein product [Ambrosiozyma monospora]|uniref:Unnamed protein product n=1 Tax=Ambrosiozyma monospora TaxID=43982 RepID=A0A9W7DF87_AMBMO|nr:unnamed protein product [Ambrosiozyma monospora]GMG28664.1 unnamed protein product [Ambrosiozyma monospora]